MQELCFFTALCIQFYTNIICPLTGISSPEYNKETEQHPEAAMSVSSLDILNLSHALKDVCEVDCETCPALTNTLRMLSQLTLIRAQLEYGKQLIASSFALEASSFEDST